MKRGKTSHPSLSSLASKVDLLDGAVRSHAADIQQSLKDQQAILAAHLAEMKSHEDKILKLVDQSLKESLEEGVVHKSCYADMVKGSCAEMVKQVNAHISSLPKPGVHGGNKAAHDLTGALEDYMDKEKRKANLVVHNLPEQSGESLAEREANDTSLFIGMIKDEMKLNVKVRRSFRAGKRMNERPRLLILTLESLSSKHDILKLAPQLSHSNKYTNIYMTPDLIRKEREMGKKLRDELSRRKRSGEANLTIRGGKIVRLSMSSDSMATKAPRHPKPQDSPVNASNPQAEVSEDGGAVAIHGAEGDNPTQCNQLVTEKSTTDNISGTETADGRQETAQSGVDGVQAAEAAGVAVEAPGPSPQAEAADGRGLAVANIGAISDQPSADTRGSDSGQGED